MEFVDAIQNFTIANMNLQFVMRNKDNLSDCYGYAVAEHLSNAQTSYVSGANLIFQKLSKSNNNGKSEVSFMFDSNIKKKFENFTRYMGNREQSLMKDPMDHWNHMSTGYSEFFSSPRGYSYVSNSVASYLIGGFVGSKSQMNNDKHKLSYDLGEVIFNILNNYKCDKSLDKFKEEKKFDVNRMGRKGRFFPRDQNELYECEYNMAIWNSLVDKSKDAIKMLNNNSCNKVMEVNKENMKNLFQVSDKTNLDSPIPEMEQPGDGSDYDCDNGGKDCHSNQMENGNTVMMCLNTSSDNICSKEKLTNVNSIRDNENTKIPFKSEVEVVPSGMENHISDMNSQNIPASSGNSHTLESRRRRQYSECSAESTDSESFIVFEDSMCCDSSCELVNLNYQEWECEDSDCYCEDDDCDFEEDIRNSCGTRSKDEFDYAYEDKEVKEANKRWRELYKDVTVKDDDDSQKKVQFSDDTKVHRIVAWDYAYRAARYGPWEQMARDRVRFKEKIDRLSSIISPVLEESHRKSVYRKLQNSIPSSDVGRTGGNDSQILRSQSDSNTLDPVSDKEAS